MKLFILIKCGYDPEQISIKDNRRVDKMNPYDQAAVHEGVKLKQMYGGKVTVVSLAGESTKHHLRTALSMGADEAVWIKDNRHSEDAYTTALRLAQFFKDEEADLILAGDSDIFSGSGHVGPMLAERIGIPVVSGVESLEVRGDKAILNRVIEGEKQIVQSSFPLLLTFTKMVSGSESPSAGEIKKAEEKPLVVRESEALWDVKTVTVDITFNNQKSFKKGVL